MIRISDKDGKTRSENNREEKGGKSERERNKDKQGRMKMMKMKIMGRRRKIRQRRK